MLYGLTVPVAMAKAQIPNMTRGEKHGERSNRIDRGRGYATSTVNQATVRFWG